MAEIFSPADLARLHDLVHVVWGQDEAMPVEDVRASLPESLAIVTSGWRYGDILDGASKLRAIIDVAGGFPSRLDYDQCYEKRIRVLTAAPAMGHGVAEMALGMALAASRDIVAGDRAMREGTEKWLHAGNAGTFLLYGKRVGFIGYGGLARCLRPLLEPFGCHISVFDPWLGSGYLRRQGLEPVTLEQLLAVSKVIFVLAPPTPEDAGMLSRPMLELIAPGSVVVLISRSHLVDFDALTELVLAGRFKAAIDVFPEEPLPAEHPIRGAAGAVLSAHRAGSVQEGLWELGEMLIDDLEAIVCGLPPQRLQVAQPELIPHYIGR